MFILNKTYLKTAQTTLAWSLLSVSRTSHLWFLVSLPPSMTFYPHPEVMQPFLVSSDTNFFYHSTYSNSFESSSFLAKSDVLRVRKLQFRFAIFRIPVICLRRNSLCLIVANFYWLQSMYNDLILMVHKLTAPLQHQTADLGGTTSCYLMASSMQVMSLACYPW